MTEGKWSFFKKVDLKQHGVEFGSMCNLVPLTVSESNTTVVNIKSPVCNNLSDVTLPSHLSYKCYGGGVSETETPFILYQETEPST